MEQADLLVGHQLSSDLAVLAANGDPAPEAVATVRAAWHARTAAPGFVIDTRFDTGPILTGRSRRLVDVCTELGLDVTQPELGSKSMTALHRQWTDHRNTEARERITVLNPPGSHTASVLAAMAQFCAAWAPVYDAVFYCADNYHQDNDPMRAKVTHLQDAAGQAVLDTCTAAGVALHHVPTGLTVDQRVTWVARHIDTLIHRPASAH